MAKQKEEALATIKYLAEQLGVNLYDQRIAIATKKEIAKARMYDGSLEAKVISTQRGMVTVESPRSPGIWIELVDHTKDVLAPEEAIYRIQAYMPKEGQHEMLNGDVFSVYVGRRGLILSDAGRRRSANLPKE